MMMTKQSTKNPAKNISHTLLVHLLPGRCPGRLGGEPISGSCFAGSSLTGLPTVVDLPPLGLPLPLPLPRPRVAVAVAVFFSTLPLVVLAAAAVAALRADVLRPSRASLTFFASSAAAAASALRFSASNLRTSSAACLRFSLGSQVLSESGYPFHLTKYMCFIVSASMAESTMASTSYSPSGVSSSDSSPPFSSFSSEAFLGGRPRRPRV